MIQWRIFAEHVAMDRKEREEFLRDLVEYGMAFHNYEAVKQVQRRREVKESLDYQENEQAFMDQIEKLFGKKLDPSHLNQAKNNPNNVVNEFSDQPEEDTIRIRKMDK